MKRLRTLAEFQKEAALGLGALALMLLGVNVAANWALFGVTEQLRESNRTELTTLAFELAARVERNSGAFDQPGSGASTAGILYSARLIAGDLSVVQYGRSAPSAVNDLPALERLRELLAADSAQFSQFKYLRDSRSNWALFHCPVLIDGQWRTLVVTRETSLLARLETASQALFWVGAALIALLGVVIIAVFRAVSRPFERIQSQIATVAAGERDAEGAVEYLVEDYQRIIADLREKETRLLELNRQLSERITDVERINRYLLSSISTGVALLDAQGRVIGLNDLAAERLNCQRTDAAEDYVGLFAELPELKRRVEAALVQPESDEFDLTVRSPDESERSLRISIFPLKENDGSLSELALFIADQTQLARAQKRLEDSRRLATLGEMAAGLAHQLRNSISAALGFGSLARRRASVADASVEPIESLLKELHEEAALVDRFLSFARPLALSTERLAITDWLTDCLESYQARPDSRDRITVSVPPELERLTLEIDPLLLKQALVNLVDNALRAAAGCDDLVQVAVSQSGERVLLEVRDSGPGVSVEDRERIFTPFYSGSPDGAGLGLPLARKIVELHGGSLELADEPSAGAVFRLQLPLTGEETIRELERIPAEAGERRIGR